MSVKVIAQLNPFSIEKQTFTFNDNESIKEIIDAIGPYEASMARVLINDEIITDFDRIPEDEVTVYLKFVPEGGGGDTKQTGQKMEGWGVVTALVGVGLLFVPGMQAIGVSLILTGGSMVASGYAISNIDIPSLGDRERPQQRPSIRGSRNRENQYGYIPVVLGRHLIYPDLAAKSYTVIEGNDQWLVQLFCAGYKDIIIDYSTFKLGDTKLTEYSETGDITQIISGYDSVVKLQVIQNGITSPLYPKVCREKQVNGIIKHLRDDGTVGDLVNTTPDKTTSINVDIFFYNGLGQYNSNGDVVGASVEVVAYYKKESDPDSAYVSFGAWDGVGGTVISGSELKTKRYQVSKTGLPAGAYTVKLVRVSGDSTDTKVVDAVYLGSIRSFSDETPVRPGRAADLTIVALKVKATDRLSQTIDTFNFIAQSKIPAYSGVGSGPSAWPTVTTKNPAAMLKYVLQGRINSVPVANLDIDWASIEAWGNWCSDHGYECNAVISNKMTLSDLTMAIARTGRAETVKIDSKFSIVHDGVRESPVQLFTPRNTKAYQQTIAFADIPDALELGFIDETAGYSDNDRVVYNTDDGQQGPEEPETKQSQSLWGITKASQAFVIGRYQYACMKLRPRFHRIDVDFEYLMSTKGDRIQYAGDTALIGTAYGRIKELTLSAGNVVEITLDEHVTIEAGKNYGMRIRKSTGELILVNIHSAVGYTNVFYPDTPIPEADAPKVLDLVALGERGFETLDLIIMAINTIDDWNATLSCVDYSPEIFEVDDPDYVIPDFESMITVGGVVDDGVVNPSEWKLYESFHDSTDEPNPPTGDGTSDGWHAVSTLNSKWRSTKLGKTRSESTWGPPIPTATLIAQEIRHGTDEDIPDDINSVTAVARQDYVDVDWAWNGDSLKNSIKRFIVERSLDAGTSWSIIGYATESRYLYYFNRSTDGYPEKTTGTQPLNQWRFRVRAENIYGQISLGYGPSSAGQAIDLTQYLTWIPPAPVVTAVAEEKGLQISWSINRDVYYGTDKSFNVRMAGSVVRYNEQSLSYFAPFDRAVDGYPETIANGGTLDTIAVTVTAVTVENTSGAVGTALGVDVSNYLTWKPAQPLLAVSASGRNITLAMRQGNLCYAFAGFRIQIQKNADGANWYAPGASDQAYVSETAYRTGDIGDFYLTPLESFNQQVPLEGQTADLPIDTSYFYRIYGVSNKIDGTPLNISPVSSVQLGLARATGTKDVIESAIKGPQIANDSITNEKIVSRTITTEELNVVARSKINNLSNDLDGTDAWTIAAGVTVQAVDGERAFKFTAPTAMSAVSDEFDVSAEELIEFSFGLQCPNYTTNSGLYIGLTMADSYTRYQWNFTTKKWVYVDSKTNQYFINDFKATSKLYYKTYILGNNVDIKDVPAPKSTDESYSIYCLKLAAGKTKASIREWNNAVTAGTIWYFIRPMCLSVGSSKINAEQVNVRDLSAITANLGEIRGDEGTENDYRLVMSSGYDGVHTGNYDYGKRGTLLLGSLADDSYFRRAFNWVSGKWEAALKVASFLVDAVSSTIIGAFKVRNLANTVTVFEVDPTNNKATLNLGLNLDAISSFTSGTSVTQITRYFRICTMDTSTRIVFTVDTIVGTSTIRNTIEISGKSVGAEAVKAYDVKALKNGPSSNGIATIYATDEEGTSIYISVVIPANGFCIVRIREHFSTAYALSGVVLEREVTGTILKTWSIPIEQRYHDPGEISFNAAKISGTMLLQAGAELAPETNLGSPLGSATKIFSNIYGQYLQGPYGTFAASYDEWERLNPGDAHTNGIYCGTKPLRTDGEFQVGASGASFKANSSGAWGLTPATSDNSTRVATTAYVKAQTLESSYPVGCYYVQFPNASSNTDSAEFPTSQRPATLFGGTWVEQWSTESVFFRTRGTLSDSGRTNGSQDSDIGPHTHSFTDGYAYDSGIDLKGESGGWPEHFSGDRTSTTAANTGTETRPVNRRIKVWKRTA